MKAYLSTESPIKHAAVQTVFERLGIDVETVPVPVTSGVSEQPSSIDETYDGARNRHEALLAKVGNALTNQYFITIESGIFAPRAEHNFFGTTVLFVDYNGERHVGIDTDIEFPKHMTDRVPGEFKDMGELVRHEFGAATNDPFPYFTNGKITRQSILENALWRVLVQFSA